MPKTKSPRSGSMQFWPRKKAKRSYTRIRSWVKGNKPGLLGFAGYKAGMTHIIITDNRPNSKTKGQDISWPVTIIECPPLKAASLRFYKKTSYGLVLSNEIMTKADKDLGRKVSLPKKTGESELEKIKPEDYEDIRLLVYTQPKLTGIGKKKPELFEMGLGGSITDKFSYAKDNLGKEIRIEDVFAEGQQIDIHAVTKGKGFQGPVKRFGIGIRSHKSEKTKRGPGSLGGWKAQGHFMYRVAHAGQTGYHARTEHNKLIIRISSKADEINPAGGFIRYGNVKNTYLLVKGSVPGATKRIIRFSAAQRPNRKVFGESPSIVYTSTKSKQKR